MTKLQKLELGVIVTVLLAVITFAFWLGSLHTRIGVLDGIVQPEEFAKHRELLLAEIHKLVEKAPKPLPTVAFSATGESYSSQGGPGLLDYKTTLSNVGNAWSGQVFTAPRTGEYVFSLGFLRDASDPELGASNDVYLQLHVNGEPRAGAWAGHGGGPRQSASTVVILSLNSGDRVGTYVRSDNESRRHIRSFWLTGFAL